MKESVKLLSRGFESSSGPTPEFNTFYRIFCSEMKKLLSGKGCTNIVFSKGHFYVSGFFTGPSGQIWYFSLSDVRGFQPSGGHFGSLLYRTAKDYKDYTGGSNQYAEMSENLSDNLRIR